MKTITRPTGLSLRDWADQITFDLESFGTFGRLQDVERWQDWAAQFSINGKLAGSVPNPYEFQTWQAWAERLCQTLS